MPQLNIEIDESLLKRVKYACIEDNIKLKSWVSAALELALDFDQAATALGWTPPGAQEIIEIVEDSVAAYPPQPPVPSQSKRVRKAH